MPRRRAYQFFKYLDREFHQLPALCPLSFFVSFVHVGHAVDGEVEIVNAMQSLRVFVVPRSGKRREIAPKETMSRDNEQRRNTSNAKSVERARAALSSVGRIAALLKIVFHGLTFKSTFG